ncbi:translation initiation factor IF-2 [bacterium]|nr:translation initiation factor IF-2 [bacterium]
MTTQKVYEFAKEIGVETITLMDKIRKWGLPIKSHMADLNPDLIEQIRSKLNEESSSAKDDGKKKVAKKVTKKASSSSETKEETAAKPAAKKTVAKAPVKTAIKATTTKAPAAKTAAAAPAKTAASSKTVIRRKKTEEAEVVEEKQISPELESQTVEIAASAGSVEKEEVVVSAKANNTEVVTAPTVTTDEKTPVSGPRKREILMTEDGPVSGVRSAKRNIIGRMDLNRVNQLPQARQAKTANRTLRTGFISQDAPEEFPPVVSDMDDRNKDKKRRVMVAPAPAAAKDKEQAPPSFVSADFMKREIVFQPKKKKIAEGPIKKTQITMPKAHKRIVKVHGSMSLNELAQAMGVKAPAVIKALMNSGVVASINTTLDFDTIALVVPEFKFEAQNVKKTDLELIQQTTFVEEGTEQIHRSPVVTVMGHVDHGKTTLLDSIRKARVAAGEAGGITQHIGAYRVKTALGEVTFIDTPGHEAFTAMRARGANVTDIVILVVAADDGVMPQTIEAINHAKAANVPIIVAVNKMDKPDASPDRIKQQMTEYELIPEEWGGSTQFCPVSALKGDGIAELLEQVSVLAEVLELKANPNRSATGIVIESRVEKGRGNVATLLIQDGTLKIGQPLVVGTVVTRVRVIHDDTGKVLKEAGPSMPVEIIGLPESPNAGDRFDVCKDDKSAEEIARVRKEELAKSNEAKPVSLEDLFSKLKAGEVKELPVILKCDVAGSAEAVKGLFDKISTSEVKLKLIHSAIGAISESDVLLAHTTKGMIVGFNVRPDTGAQAAAKAKGVEIKTYSIVYELVDDMKRALAGLLDPIVKEKVLGRVQVRNTFSVPKIGTIAGCFVTDGMVTRNSLLRLLREGKVIYQGKISSLKRFKDDAREVQTGFECGISIENFNDIKVGDEIEAYTQESVVREL